jgi:hypothetical protein
MTKELGIYPRNFQIAMKYQQGGKLSQIAEEYALSRERIRQIHAKQLRNELKAITGNWPGSECYSAKNRSTENFDVLCRYAKLLALKEQKP